MPHIHETIDFAADVFVVFENKVLLRMHDKYHIWLAVGGHIELDEDPNQAAIREVKEEVGLDVELVGEAKQFSEAEGQYLELIPPRFMNIHPVSDTHKHISLVFFAKSKTDEVVVPEEIGDRSDEWHWFSKEELKENKHGIKGSIVYYALTALEEVV